MSTTITTSTPRGTDCKTVVVAGTPAAEAAAVEFLSRETGGFLQGLTYRVILDVKDGDDIGPTLMEFLSPTCEHGMSLQLCYGPNHYPSMADEAAWEVR